MSPTRRRTMKNNSKTEIITRIQVLCQDNIITSTTFKWCLYLQNNDSWPFGPVLDYAKHFTYLYANRALKTCFYS